MKINFRKGISIIEIMIAIAILAVVSSIVVFSFSDLNKKQALDKGVENALSILGETRSKAMSSQDFSNYGVRLSTTSLISFKGDAFDSGVDKKEYKIDSLIYFNYNILPSGSDIIFKKVTGETDQSGILTFYLHTNPADTRRMEIYKTGVLEIK